LDTAHFGGLENSKEKNVSSENQNNSSSQQTQTFPKLYKSTDSSAPNNRNTGNFNSRVSDENKN